MLTVDVKKDISLSQTSKVGSLAIEQFRQEIAHNEKGSKGTSNQSSVSQESTTQSINTIENVENRPSFYGKDQWRDSKIKEELQNQNLVKGAYSLTYDSKTNKYELTIVPSVRDLESNGRDRTKQPDYKESFTVPEGMMAQVITDPKTGGAALRVWGKNALFIIGIENIERYSGTADVENEFSLAGKSVRRATGTLFIDPDVQVGLSADSLALKSETPENNLIGKYLLDVEKYLKLFGSN